MSAESDSYRITSSYDPKTTIWSSIASVLYQNVFAKGPTFAKVVGRRCPNRNLLFRSQTTISTISAVDEIFRLREKQKIFSFFFQNKNFIPSQICCGSRFQRFHFFCAKIFFQKILFEMIDLKSTIHCLKNYFTDWCNLFIFIMFE